MTDATEDKTEEEIAAEATEDITADGDENTNNVETPIYATKDNIVPLTSRELLERALLLLQVSATKSEKMAKCYDDMREEFFGPDVSPEEAINAPVDDKRQCLLINEFLRIKFECLNSDAVSFDENNINKAFEEIFALVDMELNAAETTPSYYDNKFELRCSQIPELLEEYKIMQLNRDLYCLYKAKGDTVELNQKVMDMENYFSKGLVTREQLAQFYYNVGTIYDIHISQRNTKEMVDDEHMIALDYKRNALDMTLNNMALILNVHKDWRNHNTYDSQQILNACHRVIDNSPDARSLYRAHKLYSETLSELKRTDGFSHQREKRYASIIKHYKKAVEYTDNDNEKVYLYRTIASWQKKLNKINNDPKKKNLHVITGIKAARLLHYRARIREYSNLVNETDNVRLKIYMCKAALNEFYELGGIDNEDRQLYDDLDSKFRQTLKQVGGNQRYLFQLDELKKIYGTVAEPKEVKKFSTKSSSGHDWFKNIGGR